MKYDEKYASKLMEMVEGAAEAGRDLKLNRVDFGILVEHLRAKVGEDAAGRYIEVLSYQPRRVRVSV